MFVLRSYGAIFKSPTRIVLNTNLEKAYVDPFGPPDENGKSEFEPVDDYF